MDLRDAAQTIKDSVTMDEVLALYGYSTKGGFMPCPFHGEKQASLKVYKGSKGWHCFGCGRGGSVLDFVMEHDGCGFSTAVKALDRALDLHLLEDDDPFNYDKRRQYRAIVDLIYRACMDSITETERYIESLIGNDFKIIRYVESLPKQNRTARQWTELLAADDHAKRLEDEKLQCEALRKEVMQWKTEAIKAR